MRQRRPPWCRVRGRGQRWMELLSPGSALAAQQGAPTPLHLVSAFVCSIGQPRHPKPFGQWCARASHACRQGHPLGPKGPALNAAEQGTLWAGTALLQRSCWWAHLMKQRRCSAHDGPLATTKPPAILSCSVRQCITFSEPLAKWFAAVACCPPGAPLAKSRRAAGRLRRPSLALRAQPSPTSMCRPLPCLSCSSIHTQGEYDILIFPHFLDFLHFFQYFSLF